MVELACAVDPRFIASRLEDGPAKSYSYDTISKVRDSLSPQDELFFLIGADAFAEIHTWHRADDVMAMVRFVVVTRPGHQYHTPPAAQVEQLETLALPVSSSEIRHQLSNGASPPELPDAVLQYIRERGLYK
jgi:nicotinate-nucleotide adenylyltransferase